MKNSVPKTNKALDAARQQRSLNARIRTAAMKAGTQAGLMRKCYTFALFLKIFFNSPVASENGCYWEETHLY